MGPCTANARRPTADSRCRGTTISCCVADLRRCLPTTSVTGVQQLTRYCGALPCRRSDTLCTSSFMDDVIFAHKPSCSTLPPSWRAVHTQHWAWLYNVRSNTSCKPTAARDYFLGSWSNSTGDSTGGRSLRSMTALLLFLGVRFLPLFAVYEKDNLKG